MKRGKKILGSKYFVRYATAVLFLLAGLITAIIFESNTNKKESLANLASRLEGTCPSNNCGGPKHNKSISNNNDGTYKLSLDVTGEASTEIDVNTKVNVLIVYDVSSSMTMYRENGGTTSGPYRADVTEKAVYTFLDKLNNYQNNNNIDIALVTFAQNNTATIVDNWNTNIARVRDRFSSTGTSHKFNYDGNNGTNWRAAMEGAEGVLDDADEDPTFVVFVTDGAPTAASGLTTIRPTPTLPWTDYRPYYEAARAAAQRVQNYKTGESTEDNTSLFGIYAYGTEADLLDDLIYYSYTGSDRQGMNGGTVTNTNNYYNAGSTTALNAAISDIFQEIVNTLGVGKVSIEDGTTANVTTNSGEISHLLEVDDHSFEYWLYIPITGNTITRTDLSDGSEYEITITPKSGESGTFIVSSTKWGNNSDFEVQGEMSVGEFKYKWTKANRLYNYAPPAAQYDGNEESDTYGSVKWDLKNLGTLLNDVKYQVTFDVYPSQYTYDLIADLQNGVRTYDSLDEQEKLYLSDTYELKTNTYAKLTYSDTRPNPNIVDQTVDFNIIEGKPLDADKVQIEKKWPNALDARGQLDSEGNPLVLKMKLIKDGTPLTEEKNTITVSEETNWKDTKYIATGLLRTKETSNNPDENISTGTIEVLDKGHDYSLEEPSTITYHWELVMEITHPMVINGTLTTLIEASGEIPSQVSSAADNTYVTINGKTYYKFNGKTYVQKSASASSGMAELTAYNYRKSYLEFKKVVKGDAPKDKYFNFTFTVNNEIGDYEEDSDVWFSVCDSNIYNCENTDPDTYQPVKGIITDAKPEIKNGSATGYYSQETGKPIKVKLKDGWNLRVTNLGTGSTYTITEDALPTENGIATEYEEFSDLETSNPKYFVFDNISIEAKSEETLNYVCEEGASETADCRKNGTTISGTVIKPNTAYSITYTNKYPGTYVTAEKNWLVENQETIQDKSIEVQLLQQIKGENEKTPVLDKDGQPVTATLNKDNNWKYTFEGLPLVTEETEPRQIEYFVEESGVQGYTTSIVQGKADETGAVDKHIWVVTNIEQTEILVTKEWDDANNQDGKRPTKDLTFTLKDGEGNVINKTPTKITDTEDNKDYYKYTELDKYDSEGNLINYTVTETVPAGYTVSAIRIVDGEEETVTGAAAVANAANSYTLTNTYVPEVIDVTVNKSWADGFDQDGARPDSVEVTLYQKIGEGEATPVKDKNGNIVKATLEYVEKDGEEDQELSWKHIFEDLPRYSNGQEITYSVVETKDNEVLTGTNGPGTYAIDNGGTVKGADGTITVTNTHTPETVTVTATKVWNDNNNQDGIRPKTITFTLTNDKNVTISNNSIELDGTPDEYEEGTDPSRETSAWVVTFKNLPKYSKGEEIGYSVTEETDSVIKGTEKTDDAAGTYRFEVTGSMANGFTIKNTHTPETVDIPVEKVWVDTEDQSNRISVNVQLYQKIGNADRVAVSGKTTTLSQTNSWKDTFTGLPKYSNASQVTGKQTEIVYSVVETTTVAGYNAPEYATEDGTLQIINTLSKTKVTVVKQWNDNNNKYDNRPEDLTIALNYGDKTCTLTEKVDWTCTFDNLPTHVGGKAFTYDADETSVPTGYVKGEKQTSTDADGIKTITINNNIETTSLRGNKTWSDSNQEGNQPTSVTINLMENGNAFEGKTYQAEGPNWTYEFTGLPKYIGQKEAKYSVTEDVPKEYNASYNGNNTINTLKKVKITGVKEWPDKDQYGNQTSITVILKRNGVQVSNATVSAATNWEFTFDNLPEYVDHSKAQYTIEEQTPAGYNGKIEASDPVVDENNVTVYNYTITNTLKTTTISGQKQWNDSFDQSYRPDSINIHLLRDGTVIDTKTVDEDDNWSYEWTNLPTHVDTKEVKYTVSEDVPAGYKSTVVGYNITNTLISTQVKVTKSWPDKNQYGNQTAVTVRLKADGNLVEGKTLTLTKDNNWTGTFTNLPKYVKNTTTPIKYEVVEDEVPGYEGKVSTATTTTDGEGNETISYTITNTLKKTEATVTKVWDDTDNQDGIRPPELVVTLSNGQTVTLNEGNKWTATIKDLPVYVNGNEFNYTWSEDQKSLPAGYSLSSTTKQGTVTTITNSRATETVSLTVEKDWDDNGNQDGLRPDNIEITLYSKTAAEDTKTKVETFTLGKTSDDEYVWSKKWNNLAKYRKGKLITYSVVETRTSKLTEEDSATTYKVNDSQTFNGADSSTGVIKVTNTHTPEQTSIEVTKKWADNSNQDGLRNENTKVTFELYADGISTGKTVELSGDPSDNQYSETFTGLDKYRDAGTEIVYTVKETIVPQGYTASSIAIVDGERVTVEGNEANGNKDNNYTITNTHKTSQISIDVTKKWVDNSNQDGLRNENTKVVFELYANGKSTGKTVELSGDPAKDSYNNKFENLDEYAGGEKITYTVKEKTGLANYTATAEGIAEGEEAVGNAANDYTITNTHNPAETEVLFTKKWSDNNDQDGLREKATYQITIIGTRADGETVTIKNATVTLVSSVKTYKYEHLPVYDHGQLITYTIKETTEPEGYTATAKGIAEGEEVVANKDNDYTITNVHKPAETSLTITKIWDDEDDQDGIRPKDITIVLLADGDEYTKATQPKPVKNGDTWTYTFEGLPLKNNGKVITWTATEDTSKLEGYVASAEGIAEGEEVVANKDNDYTITNTHEPALIDIPISKQWVDAKNQDGIRPESITVILKANGKEVDRKNVYGGMKDTTWTYTFTDKPQFASGKEIDYTIEELTKNEEGKDLIPGYEASKNEDDKFEIINTHSPSEKVVEGTKTWVDNDNQDGLRPDSITIKLLVDGEPVIGKDGKEITAVVSEDNDWSYKFEHLPEFKDGNLIVYQVDEGSFENDDKYSKAVNNYNITNTHTPEIVNIEGSKVWDDADNQDGLRPDSITVKLLADGEAVIKDGKELTATTNAAAGWKFTFDELPKYKNPSQVTGSQTEIKYTVEEVQDGKIITGNQETGYAPNVQEVAPSASEETEEPEEVATGKIVFKVTNTHKPATVTYTITKDWDDLDNNDGLRPDSITVKLFADGTLKETVKVTAKENWTYTFGPMAKKAAGKDIVYTIEEEPVAGYTPSKNTPVVTNKTITQVITNKHTPEKTSINGKKTWIDENDKDGKRPKTITVYVYADGKIVAELTVSADSNWEYALENLNKYNKGVEIKYTIEEAPVDGYDTEYEGFDITNIITEVAGEEEELPPDTFTKDQSTYRLDLLLMLIGGMILSNYKRVIKE